VQNSTLGRHALGRIDITEILWQNWYQSTGRPYNTSVIGIDKTCSFVKIEAILEFSIVSFSDQSPDQADQIIRFSCHRNPNFIPPREIDERIGMDERECPSHKKPAQTCFFKHMPNSSKVDRCLLV
jgi:hypothetical protein